MKIGMRRLSAITLMILMFISIGVANAVPQMPNKFYGSVTIGGSPAPDGVLVEAKIGGITYETELTVDGKYGYTASDLFYVPADDPDTAPKEGGVNGDTVEFYVGGLLATTHLFEIGGTTKLDLPPETGTQPELPAETTNQATKDSTGAPKTSFVLGETVLVSAEVANAGTQSQPMLIVVQWTDPDLRAMAPVFIGVTLAPGQSFVYAPGLTLPLTGYTKGTWTAKIMVFSAWPSQGGVTIGAPVTITITVS